jgi:hypothetical protein
MQLNFKYFKCCQENVLDKTKIENIHEEFVVQQMTNYAITSKVVPN